MLALNTLLVVLDSVAAGVAVFQGALGGGINPSGTVSAGAASNVNTLVAIDDESIQRELTPVFARRAEMVTAAVLYPALLGALLQRALDRHYGSMGGVNAFLANSDARVHANLRLIGMATDARNTMPPVLDPIGAWVDGWAHAVGIDTSLYGETPLEVVIDVQSGTDKTYSLSLKRFDGSIEQRELGIGAEPGGTLLPIGDVDDRFVDVIAVERIDGTDGGGQWHVRSKVERAIVL